MDEENNEQEDSLSKYYEFEKEDEREAYMQQREGYFGTVSSLIPKVTAAKYKLENIQTALREKVKKLRDQIKEQTEQQKNMPNFKNLSVMQFSDAQMPDPDQNVDEESLLQKDLVFCEEALVEGQDVANKIDGDRLKLENILATHEKQPYKVIVDVALKPLPSDRAKEQDKDKEKEKNKNKKQKRKSAKKSNEVTQIDEGKSHLQSVKDKIKKRSGVHSKMSLADWKKLRNGQSLDSVQEEPLSQRRYVPVQNINAVRRAKQNGGLGS